MLLRKKISLCRSTRLRYPPRYFCHLHPHKNFPKVFVFRWKCLCRNVRGAWINYFFKSVFSEMLFYFCVLAVCWSASYAIAYWSSFMRWRSHSHQLRIALMPDTNIIPSNKEIGLCRTLGLTQSQRLCNWEGPQVFFPKGFVHHFVMSKVACIHQQVKLVDECQMFSKSNDQAIEEFIYAMNQISLHRSNAIAIYEAWKMSENDWNLQSQSRSGHDWTPVQRLVHTRCLVKSLSSSEPRYLS